ncbi:MAG: zinc carboxypeptidase [Saprospiraceae bacterium]|nr:MAG: peptidase M14 carboxypeptidase A [Candidatus Parvibacillus calidus]MBK7739483.1 zinc carboxypeptidase [Candidatus Parvibacillus calidus]MCC7147891.1 zinc carboxypeptidase [Saprospiraceae bacterium]WKZ62928.1 MAG: M14 family zinc carboxypeptidase [Saprospiraceae bacterium]
MKKHSLIVTALFALLFFQMNAQVITPESFLGYKPGNRYTPHHTLIAYFKSVAEKNNERVLLTQYGTSYEGRPLITVFISTAENIANLENIRKNHLALIEPDKSEPDKNDKCIVWLSYNVHGNEASGSEAAMTTLHEILSDADFNNHYKDMIVVIDPCLNPDGRERYTNWYTSMAGSRPDSKVWSREHQEPWPGGRTNHYYFDLNRDWAWQTQLESQSRLKLYNDWMPQIHVDFHEQGYNIPYYFAPAAEPYHEAITPFQRSFQKTIGQEIASEFDKNGWLYFTRERFDLFYPSYGDTYPIYNGAIGMTFEQAGGKNAGISVMTKDGELLSLYDRIAHHTTSGMSTIKVVRDNIAKINSEFFKFFHTGINTQHYHFQIKETDYERARSFKSLLDKNKIRYRFAQHSDRSATLTIPLKQPKSTLIKILMEENSRLTDSLTYDITAWNLPKAFGLNYSITANPMDIKNPPKTIKPTATAYGYAIAWQGGNVSKALSWMLQQGIRLRFSENEFSLEGTKFDRGTLLILDSGSNRDKNIREVMDSVVNKFDIAIKPISRGMVDTGNDMGSESIRVINAPKVILLSGEGVFSLSLGEIWFHMDMELDFPVSLVNTSQLRNFNWSDADIIILPDGNYSFLRDKELTDQLENWIRRGGKLIAFENAVNQLTGLNWVHLKKKDSPADSTSANKYSSLKKFGDRERAELKNYIPGSIYRIDLDNTHPLAFGYPSYYYSLKLNSTFYNYIKDGGWNVGVIKGGTEKSGFIGSNVRSEFKDAFIFGVEQVGKGNIVYFTDNILFRNFWENGKLLFDNALFLVGQ